MPYVLTIPRAYLGTSSIPTQVSMVWSTKTRYVHLLIRRRPAPESLAELFHLHPTSGKGCLATTQICLFIFAGNDSTSSTIVYAHHILYNLGNTRQRWLAFGETMTRSSVASVLPSNSKRSRRASTNVPTHWRSSKKSSVCFVRGTRHGVSIQDQNDRPCPVSYLESVMIHRILHRHPPYCVRPDEVLPKRWLVDPAHELCPPQNRA
jgi:hypothetical protein